MTQRTIQVDLGGGLLTVEIDDATYSTLIAAAIAAHDRRGRRQHSPFEYPAWIRDRMNAGSAPHATRPTHPITVFDALAVLEHYLDGASELQNGSPLRRAVRRAKRLAHPDTGGDATDFQLVTAAEDVLRRAGRL